jgi:hypothetical protein
MGVTMKYIKFLFLNIVVFGTLFLIISLLLPANVGARVDFNLPNNTKDSFLTKIKNTQQWCALAPNLTTIVAQNDSVLHIAHSATNGTNYQSVFTFYKQDSGKAAWTLQQKLPWYNPFAKFRAMVAERTTATIMDSCVKSLLR